MESLAFDRVYHLELIYKSLPNNTDNFVESITLDKRVVLTENRISFNANYSAKANATSNPKQILTIYNIDKSLESYFKKQGSVIKLRAGYSSQLDNPDSLEDLPLILEADVVACKIRHTDVDSLMVLTLVEFAEVKKISSKQITIPKGVSLGNTITQIGNGITQNINVILSKEKSAILLPKRKTYSTTPLEVLRRLAIEYELHVYFFNDHLTVSDKGLLTSQDFQAEGVNPLRIPSEEIIGGLDLSVDFTKALKSSSGVEVSFTLLFNPYIKLDRLIDIYSKEGLEFEAKGTYRISALSHSLDTHGGRWVSSIVATAFESPEETKDLAETLYEEVIYGYK